MASLTSKKPLRDYENSISQSDNPILPANMEPNTVRLNLIFKESPDENSA